MIENGTNILIYKTADGTTKIDVTYESETVCLSIDQMSELFQRDRSVIGKQYDVDYYNLDVIISVGYRV